MSKTVSSRDLRAMFDDREELALLDAREERDFATAHILYASCLPYGRIEERAERLLPRRGLRVVWCDAGDGLADRAAERLAVLGFSDVSVLQGGIGAWAAAGNELFSGINVPSKGFGECIEQSQHTPSIDAATLKTRIDAGESLVVLDSRPFGEFHARSIPGGVCTPGAELVYRVQCLAPDPSTTVVVNCAGRTRSIIGAQSLIEAGVPNPVLALRNGTMGWTLAGMTLETGATRRAPAPGEAELALARERAATVRERYGVPLLDRDTLQRFESERARRSLYLFDVRQPEEYEAGHVVGSLNAPGGQLVQQTDYYAPARGARVVLVDDSGVRASMTAAWLRRMGWDAHVLADGLAGVDLETGPFIPLIAGIDLERATLCTPHQLHAMSGRGEARVLDLSLSNAYRVGHVPAAWWGVRSRLHRALVRLPAGGRVVLVSEDDRHARLAAGEAQALEQRPVLVLEGGMRAWRAARLEVESGDTQLADEVDDLWQRPYERSGGSERDLSEYLDWEVALVDQLRRDGTARFEVPVSK